LYVLVLKVSLIFNFKSNCQAKLNLFKLCILNHFIWYES